MGEGFGKPIRLTSHARAKLAERRIQRDWVDRIARQPDWTEPEPRDDTVERRFGVETEFGDRVLRLVCLETDEEIRKITATFDRSARRSR